MSQIKLYVVGLPAPQGSKRIVGHHGGRARLVESSKKVRPWRQDVKYAALSQYKGPIIEVPVSVDIVFYFPRPRSHYGTGKNAAKLKSSAPFWVISKSCGDLDKLLRSTFDALSVSSGGAEILKDDSQVAVVSSRKYYSDDRTSGAVIIVKTIDDIKNA